jgi:RNA polymerase sigma-54 factor
MEKAVNKELESNPALEEMPYNPSDGNNIVQNQSNGDTTDNNNRDDYDIMENNSSDYMDYVYQKGSFNDDYLPRSEFSFADGQTFQEYLIEQLNELTYDQETIKLAQYIIGNIDENGYLTRNTSNICDDLAFQQGIYVSEERVEAIVKIVQMLEPAGVGARTLQECLSIQLNRLEQTENVINAGNIIRNHFDNFTLKKYLLICKKLNLSAEQFNEILNIILKLNSKPGSAFTNNREETASHIIPDFLVDYENGQFYISLNDSNYPRLKVSEEYKKMLGELSNNQTYRNKQALEFTRQKVDAAHWFIEAIKQRNITLMRTMTAIVEKQSEFFATGDEFMLKPMKLKDISNIVNYNISTISRVSNRKYVQTKFGVFSLKHLFSDAIQMQNGGMVSNKRVQHIIKELLDNENKDTPINDDEITEILKAHGYVIARRTVAKYRDKLNIASSKKRTQIHR